MKNAEASPADPVTAEELRWAGGVGFLAVVLAAVPYLIAWLTHPPEVEFLGALINWEDTHSYLADIRQGAGGAWLYTDRYTTEAHPGGPLFVFYLGLGQLAGALGASPGLALALARVLCGAGLLAVLYGLLAVVVERREARQVAFGLLCFSSGLGWLALFAVGADARTWDLWVPESNTFLTLLTFPHFSLSMACMGVTLVGWYQAIRTERWGPAAWATGAAVLLAWVHPFDLPVVLVTGVGWALLQGGSGLRFVAPGALSATAVVAYLQFGVISANPVFRAWVDQGDMTMSDPVPFLLGLGLLLPLAVVGARSVEPSARFFGLWALATTVLLFLPVSVSRRFVEGLHVPLSILGAFGWLALRERLQSAGLAGRVGAAGLITGLVASTAFVWLRFVLVAVQAPRPFFMPTEEMELLRALEAEAPTVVLSAYASGNRIPAFTGHTVVVGHWHQTIDVHAKNEAVQSFFSGASAPERAELVRTHGVELLYVGPDERALGDYDPGADPSWNEVFANGAGAAYRWVGAP